jgi:type IV pilus assembly protein PilW
MNTSIQHRTISGFSLVEIMVAMIIGLIGMLVIFQVFAVSENYRRSTTSGGDAQQNGAVALYVLEHELRQAGWGFNSTNALGCSVQVYDANQGGALASYTMVPVRITPAGAASGSDTVEVNYGNQNMTLAPTSVYQNMVSSTEDSGRQQPLRLRLGRCIPDRRTGQELHARAGDRLAHGRHFQHDQSGGIQCRALQQSHRSGVLYTVNGFIFNLGSAPTRNIYTVTTNATVGTALTLQAYLNSSTLQTVADNIVQIKAQYGIDDGVGGVAAGDGIVDRWITTPQPVTAAQWAQVLAIRVGLVARSANPEKPNGGGTTCNTTT